MTETTITEDWEHEFWQMVEEKGVGSDIRFAQACRNFIKKQLTLAESRGVEKEHKRFLAMLPEECFVHVGEELLRKQGIEVKDYLKQSQERKGK